MRFVNVPSFPCFWSRDVGHPITSLPRRASLLLCLERRGLTKPSRVFQEATWSSFRLHFLKGSFKQQRPNVQAKAGWVEKWTLRAPFCPAATPRARASLLWSLMGHLPSRSPELSTLPVQAGPLPLSCHPLSITATVLQCRNVQDVSSTRNSSPGGMALPNFLEPIRYLEPHPE